MTPGAYIRACRMAAGMSLEDVALCVETVPGVSVHSRAELLRAIEEGNVPVRISTVIVLSRIPELALNTALLAELIDRENDDHLRFVVPGIEAHR